MTYSNNHMACLYKIKDKPTTEILVSKISRNLKIYTVIYTMNILVQNGYINLSYSTRTYSEQGVQYTSPILQRKEK